MHVGLIGDSPLREGAVQGFLLILFSELGDKTFFLAVLLALKENKGVVFAGTFGALAAMSVISVGLFIYSYLYSCISKQFVTGKNAAFIQCL